VFGQMGESPTSLRRIHRVRALTVALIMWLTVPQAALASGDTTVSWSAFSESSGCSAPFTATPVSMRTGFLPDSELVLGPFGRYFGWSIGEIRDQLVWWTVPGTGGRGVYVHRLAQPAFQQVAAALDAAAANGLRYPIRDAVAFAPRTIGGNHRISRHALGLAIDINPAQNPYRGDGTLITDMPPWFVQIWRDAGFCWGGDWEDSKDPMHFSWVGPGSLTPRPALTSPAAYVSRSFQVATVYGSGVVASRQRQMKIADGNGNGAPDVIALRPHPNGTVMEVASSTTGWQECSVGRWMVPGVDLGSASHWTMVDVDRDSRQDLVLVGSTGETLTVTVATRRGEYEDVTVIPTPISPAAVATVAGGDLDGDRIGDLWLFRSDGSFDVWAGPRFDRLIEGLTLGVAATRVGIADRAGDLVPEIFVLGNDGTLSVYERTPSGWQVRETVGLGQAAAQAVGFGILDHDGDARPDVNLLGPDGTLTAYFGNTALGGSPDRWYRNISTECDGELELDWTGFFFDDEASPFAADIDAIAGAGITNGCNPPFDDRFCPEELVTRGQMAAFLARALGLPLGVGSGFSDVAGSGFEAEIGALVAAGITNGCDVDRFCPYGAVTREQMAAFLHRAELAG
jgi:hypothetical protein